MRKRDAPPDTRHRLHACRLAATLVVVMNGMARWVQRQAQVWSWTQTVKRQLRQRFLCSTPLRFPSSRRVRSTRYRTLCLLSFSLSLSRPFRLLRFADQLSIDCECSPTQTYAHFSRQGACFRSAASFKRSNLCFEDEVRERVRGKGKGRKGRIEKM